jgi:hypothetical protein
MRKSSHQPKMNMLGFQMAIKKNYIHMKYTLENVHVNL